MKFNALIPELSVSNIANSKQFYLDILGFKLEYERIEDKFAMISIEEVQIMIEEINGYWNTAELKQPFGRGINFQINISNVEELNTKIKANNIKLFREIKTISYRVNDIVISKKEILVQDPDGYLLRFSESVIE